MRRRRWLPITILLVALLPGGLVLAWMWWLATGKPPGRLDLRDLGGYRRRLYRSRAPEAAAIRRIIDSGPGDLMRERLAAQQDGLPISPQQLQRPLPPPARDAAPDYLRLSAMLAGRTTFPPAMNPMGARTRYTPADFTAARKILAQSQNIYRLIRQATDKPECVFPRNWSLGPAVLFPEYARMREAARLLKTESYLLAKQGRYREAVAEQARGFRVAQHGASDPILISYLVGVACEAIALNGMEDILYTAGPNAAVAEEVRRAIAAHRPRYSLRDSLGGEYASMVTVTMKMLHDSKPSDLANLAEGEEDSAQAEPQNWVQALFSRRHLPLPSSFSPEERRFLNRLLDASEAAVLRDLHRQIGYIAKPYPERLALFRKEEVEHYDSKRDPTAPFRNLLMPVYSQAAGREVMIRAKEEVVMAGAAVLAYRARQGRFPDRLEQAMPRLPADPFTGRPMKYRREPGGFVVYSIGETGGFDGGRPGMARNARESYFRWPPLPPKPPDTTLMQPMQGRPLGR